MSFWEDLEPWMILAAAILSIAVAWVVYPDPMWAINTALAGVAVGALIVIRIIHWWDFNE